MKDVCICVVKHTDEVHSVGIQMDGRYYSSEGGGNLNTGRNLDVFYYLELSWTEYKKLIGLSIDKSGIAKRYTVS